MFYKKKYRRDDLTYNNTKVLLWGHLKKELGELL